mmetsp:Transcript_4888/g.4082  ORF Transcript_4888/g.4082 Transcript_4888/m.4082 type:complete len:83 (-) Transcript_4888:158-406(-)
MNGDLSNPTFEDQMNSHKQKRLVAEPNSYFMDVRCSCGNILTMFSHAQDTVVCSKCHFKVASPTGGKAKLSNGVSYRVKKDN